MNRIFKLFLLGSIVVFVGARLRRRTGALAHTDDSFGVSPSRVEPPEVTGISDVDPEGLTQFGEGIDPEAVRNAHAEPALLQDQLPRPGKNLP
jgi:hypothetical protein